MESSALFRPGAVLGSYPEKDDIRPGFLERAGNDLIGHVRRRAQHRIKQDQIVSLVNREEKQISGLSDSQLDTLIADIRKRLIKSRLGRRDVAQAFALVRQVAFRTLGVRHYDVQLMGGWVMLNGAVAEMETGEGKTLTATLPASVAALAGIPVHIITVNDYLVTRDAAWMSPIYKRLGLTVGEITEGMDHDARRTNYACDVVYCTNKQIVFDYLRDRLLIGPSQGRLRLALEGLHQDKPRASQLLLRGLCFAIVDEADSVLIDEARTPLIISKRGNQVQLQNVFAQALWLAERLEDGRDYVLDTTYRSIEFTAQGKAWLAEIALSMGGLWSMAKRREELASQAILALRLYHRDKDYLVRDGRIEIIDENTGRVMADRTWQRSIHQLIEAKEQCEITSEPQTLARISYQRFFRRYLKLAGMTGTAQEVADELWTVYRLRVLRVPTNKKSRRLVGGRRVFTTKAAKWAAVVERVRELHLDGTPVLVGTRTVSASEELSALLKHASIPHRVLNAHQDEHEAEIIATAGRLGQVTVATNMAGRGTDIKLDQAAADAGGLQVIVTEYHDAGRIDRQLVGRCARQGDPGAFEFMASLEDDLANTSLVRITKLVCETDSLLGTSISRYLGPRLLKKLQRKLERRHLRIRRQLLRADEKLNDLLAFSGSAE